MLNKLSDLMKKDISGPNPRTSVDYRILTIEELVSYDEGITNMIVALVEKEIASAKQLGIVFGVDIEDVKRTEPGTQRNRLGEMVGAFSGDVLIGIASVIGGLLANVYVMEEYRSCGIGTDLVNKTMELLPVKMLGIVRGDETLIKWYSKFGFERSPVELLKLKTDSK